VRVAFFVTCFNDTLFPETGIASVRILERLGHEVTFPQDQTCCGQVHFNTGYRSEAARLVKRFVRAFSGSDTVVCPSASCVGMIRQYHAQLAHLVGDPSLEREAKAMATRVFELSEFLVRQLGVEDIGAYFPHRVTYHPTCHSLRALHLGDAPHRLLRAVRGIDLVDLPDPAECCGFGGTFAVKNADTSLAMLSDKVKSVLMTRAQYCTAVDSSCLMHIGGALTRQRTGVAAVHLAQILASTNGRSA
jgi:L-lactate dehydrogenase complex protein LldE